VKTAVFCHLHSDDYTHRCPVRAPCGSHTNSNEFSGASLNPAGFYGNPTGFLKDTQRYNHFKGWRKNENPTGNFSKGISCAHCSWFICLPRCMECRRGLAMGILFVCLSVRLSVKRVPCDKTKEKNSPDFYTIRMIISPSFLKKRLVGRGRPLLPEILGQPVPVGAKSRFCTYNRSQRISRKP